jgi:hypothetical protein
MLPPYLIFSGSLEDLRTDSELAFVCTYCVEYIYIYIWIYGMQSIFSYFSYLVCGAVRIEEQTP